MTASASSILPTSSASEYASRATTSARSSSSWRSGRRSSATKSVMTTKRAMNPSRLAVAPPGRPSRTPEYPHHLADDGHVFPGVDDQHPDPGVGVAHVCVGLAAGVLVPVERQAVPQPVADVGPQV